MNLKEILGKHELWLSGDKTGERANLSCADLRGAYLSGADLRFSDLRFSDLSGVNLRDANLRDADLIGADLRGSDLSDTKNLPSAINYLKENFEHTDEGYIAYKCFNSIYHAPDKWDISIGSVIEEEVNPNRTDVCGCGINVAPLSWVRVRHPRKPVYKLLIRWEWLVGVVVPYNTDGKIRCARAEIIEKVDLN